MFSLTDGRAPTVTYTNARQVSPNGSTTVPSADAGFTVASAQDGIPAVSVEPVVQEMGRPQDRGVWLEVKTPNGYSLTRLTAADAMALGVALISLAAMEERR